MRHSFSHPSRSVTGNSRIDRRALLIGGAASVAALTLPGHAIARQATPEADSTAHDHGGIAIPEVELVGTNEALAFPGEVSAGINLITVRNDSDTIMHTFTMRIPDGMTDDEALSSLAQEDPGDWFATTFFAGTPDEPEPGGGELTGYTFYVPGHYMVVNPFSDGIVTPFDVTGETWGRPAPVADIEIGLIDMAFRGFDESIPAGPHLWRLTNHGTMWHDMTTLKAPDGSTVDDLFAAFETTSEDQIFPDGYTTTGGIGATSPGVTTWVELDLAPGTHIAACFLPGEDGMPHAFNGMIAAFEVA